MKKKNVIVVAVAAMIVVAGVLATGAWVEHRKELRVESLVQSQVQASEPEPTVAPVEEFVTEPTPAPVEQLEEDADEASDTTMMENADGSVTADREWNKKPEDANIAQDGANIAGGGGDMPMDENGEYHGEPQPSVAPQPEPTVPPEWMPRPVPAVGEESHGNGSDKIVGYM